MSWAGSGAVSRGRGAFLRVAFARRAAGALVSRFARSTAMDVTPFRGAGDSTTRPRASPDAVETIRAPLDHHGQAAQRARVEGVHGALVGALHHEVHAVPVPQLRRVRAARVDLLEVLVARAGVETLAPDVPEASHDGAPAREGDLPVVGGGGH